MTHSSIEVGEPVHFRLFDGEANELQIDLTGPIDAESATRLLQTLPERMKQRPPGSLTLNLERVSRMDDMGLLVILKLREVMSRRGVKVRMVGVPGQVKEMLDLLCSVEKAPSETPGKKRSHNIFVRLGEAAIRDLSDPRFAVSFLGEVLISLSSLVVSPLRLRWEDTIKQMKTTGVDALPIVALISFLLGLIMAFMSSIQLRQFGANIYVASLVALAMVSELGPIMTAIIVAGRSGSAYAAEIGTMKISEEIDALRTIGFDPVRFLALPRMVASLVMVPILTLFSDLFAVAGGLVVGRLMLHLTVWGYIAKTLETLTLFDVLWGIFKSLVFAFLVSWVGCLRGFQARGSASAVGRASTSAVVTSIFLIILFDSIFSVMRSYW
jgi:phospholipid/cholesterol/gamma-HCH transport system permease protein